MSFNYNHVTLVGRLTKNPELKKVGEYVKTTFMLAVDRPYRKEDGTVETDFISIVLWGKLAEVAEKYLKKGIATLIEGRLQVKDYEINNERKWFTEILAENFQILESSK